MIWTKTVKGVQSYDAWPKYWPKELEFSFSNVLFTIFQHEFSIKSIWVPAWDI